MAQNLELIVELLREMKNATSNNSENFERLLNGINEKLEIVDPNGNTATLLKNCLCELAKNLDEKYSTTLSKFTDIEDTLNLILEMQDEHVSDELKNLFKTFTDKMGKFHAEANQQKVTVSKLEEKIINVSNNDELTQKEIIKSIKLLKSDFDELNFGYKKSIENIYDSLNSILTKIADENIMNTNVKFDSIYKSTNDIVNYISSVDRRDTNLEKLLANLATNESLKLTQGIIESIVEKSDKISKKITNLASKSDVKTLKTTIENIQDNLERRTDTEIYTELNKVANNIVSQTDEIKQSLAGLTNNIDSLPDTKTFENQISKLYHRFDDFEQYLEKINSSDSIHGEIGFNFSNLTDELSTIKNIITDLNEVTLAKITSSIDNISFENQSYDIKNHISKMLSELPQKEDIERLLDNQEKILDSIAPKYNIENLTKKAETIELQILTATKNIVESIDKISNITDSNKITSTVSEIYSMIEDLKTDFLNTTELHNDSIIDKISELQKSVEQIVSVEDFNNFIEDLKAFVVDTVDLNSELNTNISEIKKLQGTITEKLDNIDFTYIKELINANHSDISTKLVDISDYITNLQTNNISDITNKLIEIKEIINNRNVTIEECELQKTNIIQCVDTYIQEIKAIFDTKDNELDAIFKNNFADLEEAIESNRMKNEDSLSEIIKQIDNINIFIKTNQGYSSSELKNSLSELCDIKTQIAALGKSFESLSYSKGSTEDNISEFVSDKLIQISSEIANITDNFDNKIQQGFAYSAELIEEKTSALLDFIKELRHNNSENIELFERLTVTDNKLMDFKQELELVNTDIINNLNSKTEQIISDLIPIKESLLNLVSNSFESDKSEIKEHFDLLHETIKNEIRNSTESSTTLYDKLENTYTKISNELSTTENNLRDFVLSDIDSVIIKIDNLREDLENTLDKIAPPAAEQMSEFKKFVTEINYFKAEQDKKLAQVASDIKTYISEQMLAQHDEIKSLLKISTNNRAILAAIENLKQTFKTKINTYSETNQNDDFGANEYEKEFETNHNYQILEDIKTDFDKFTDYIDELSDANPQIIEVLNTIKDKMKTISIAKSDEPEILEGENSDIDATSIFGANNFDIIRALDLLQEDITALHSKIERLSIQNEKQKSSIGAIPTLTNSPHNETTLDSKTFENIKNEWLEEIKTYLASSQIQTLLNEINDKVSILSLSNNSDWVNDIKNTLNQLKDIDITTLTEPSEQIQTSISEINNKIDILANTDYSLDLDDIKYTLDAIDSKLEDSADSKKLSESDARITAMLETLNHKIDIIASSSDTEFALEEVRELILAQQDSIDYLEQNNKTEAFKKCLDELTQEVNNITGDNSKEIQRTLKDMKESIMAAVITIFEQVSFIEESEDIKDFVEEKTDEINKNLAIVTEQLKQISQADPDYTYSMQDIESDLAKLRIALNQLQASEQDTKETQLHSILDNITQIGSTVQGLQISSGESYNAINNFGKDITTYLSNKVDNVAKMVEQSLSSDKVMRQALLYMGEWIDSASESMNKISTNSEEIIDIKSAIEDLKEVIPSQTNILSTIKNKFEEQEERIDRLEMALEKILNAVEDIDDTKVTRKIDKIDKQLLKLSTNIEKLASYVD
ncbi:MAG: hypothetical protein E7Z87_02815 [Cyanobacteria bacterium SIG26]|nr:hypothetical protein [Cyanobacteria bacterium SIG26]